MTKEDVLRDLKIGLGIAEQEITELGHYFVATEPWRKIKHGEIDIVYGPKGSGKSALYTLLTTVDKPSGIEILQADNPRGATVFKKVEADPPTTEISFQTLWKIYFASLVGRYLSKKEHLKSNSSKRLVKILTEQNFIDDDNETLVTSILKYLKNIRGIRSFEAGTNVDAHNPAVMSFTGKITFDEPEKHEIAEGLISVDQLIKLANQSLQEEDETVWVAIDRLDVAFVENETLEENALRALFRVYNDIASLDRIRLKIFLRSDIWQRLTRKGFREASHIAKFVSIDWPGGQLLNLIMRRLLNNPAVVEFYGLDKEKILGSAQLQEELFYRIFPKQVVPGEKRPKSLTWMLSRTADATQKTAPRELIQLLNAAKDEELRNITIGASDAQDEALIGGSAIKNALPIISKMRLEQTIYAEYPSLQIYIQKLDGQKAEQNLSALGSLWQVNPQEAIEIANRLLEIGFFEKRGNKEAPTFWIPFLYRPALNIVQGTEDSTD